MWIKLADCPFTPFPFSLLMQDPVICMVMCNWRMLALPSWLRSHLQACTQKNLPILSSMGSSPGPRMWKSINSCRNVSVMLWNPAKRHDECENCFLGHPVSFNFFKPIELFSKCLYPSILHPFVMWLPWQSSWLSRKARSSLTCYIKGLQ